MPVTLTPLRYPGGKTKYTEMFSEIISENELEMCTFVEVFAGGAGAAIKLLLTEQVKSIFINDLDVAIYAFWRTLKEQPTDLIDLICKTPVTTSEWDRQKRIYVKKDTTDMLSLGFSTFFLNRCNHSGILQANPIGGKSQVGNHKINARYHKKNLIKKIEAIAEYKESIEVFNLDAIALLNHLKNKHRDKKFLIYLDPPYVQKGPLLYLNHYQLEDHRKLRDGTLNSPFSWILSYDSHDSIIDLYKDRECKIYRNHLRHTICGNRTAEELIVSHLKVPSYLKAI